MYLYIPGPGNTLSVSSYLTYAHDLISLQLKYILLVELLHNICVRNVNL